MINKAFLLFCLSLLVIACEQSASDKQTPAAETNTELSPQERFPEQFLIRSQAVGEMHIGESLPFDSDVFEIEPTVEVITAEGMTIEQPLYILNDAKGEALYVKAAFDDQKGEYSELIGEINVISADFQTEKGMGIGASIEAFAATYPDYQIWYTYVSEMYVIESPALKAQFLLDPSGFKGKLEIDSDTTPLKLADFDPATEIIQVRLF
ncbi:MAG: hypothetical protein AAFN10_07970 [Bacteroidota bacterium]